MPSLIDIRRRIRAVKSTQQITKAMKMVAAANLRRSQERILNARPMARQISRVLGDLASRVDPSTHPLLAQPAEGDVHRVLMVVMTADKGMCGSFNANIIRAASNHILAHPDQAVTLGLIGRRGRDGLGRRQRRHSPERYQEHDGQRQRRLVGQASASTGIEIRPLHRNRRDQ
jgi:F-type H+-transporting ATPase subunit gamma